MWRKRGGGLMPHHINVIGYYLLNGPDADGLTHWVTELSEGEQQQRKDKFWQDFKLAQEAEQ